MADFSHITGPNQALLDANSQRADTLAKYAAMENARAQTQMQMQDNALNVQLKQLQIQHGIAQQQADMEVGKEAGNKGSMEEQLSTLASGLVERGQIAAGLDTWGKYQALQRGKIDLQMAQERQEQKQFEQQVKSVELLGSLLGTATNQQDWEAGNAAYEQTMGKPSPFAGQEFNPQMASRIAQMSPHMLQRMQMDLNERRMKAEEARVGIAQQREDAYEKLRAAEIQQRREAAQTRRKVGVPKTEKDTVDAAKALLQRDYPAIKDKASIYTLADETTRLMHENPEWSRAQAMQQAARLYTKKGGSTGKEEQLPEKRVPAGGKTPSSAQLLVQKPDPKTLVTGNYYKLTTKDGKLVTMRWTGTGFTPAGE